MSNDISERRSARKAAGRSLEWAAVMAGVSSATARVFELDPEGVSEESRAKLERVYQQFIPRAA
jgi:hypothetical protein